MADSVQTMGDGNTITINLSYKSNPETFTLPKDASLADLSDAITKRLSIPLANQKLIIQKLGLQKAPFTSSSPPLSSLEGKKITLMGATAAAVSSIQHAATVAHRRQENRAAALAHPVHKPAGPRNNFGKEAEDSTYTFLTIRPLPTLPDPPSSQRYLERLAADPGIRHSMRKHKFTVGLLTEMDPAMYTDVSHEGVGRTLGLNRNSGEVVELRLRTDADDGYRDYKTVRKTLCHELAHNVHGPHDQKFWKLCREIERDVEGVEMGYRRLEEEEGPVGPVGDEDVNDHGGWTGGEFVLGGGDSSGMSRREIIAKAAEERVRKLQRESGGGSGSGRQN
ncbi:hypothetical protein MKZ38_008728 [Zalerion maritima]|uniref:WLM domain-containing protein n=1 Tax=Zalerion maritima TaxID=339359 RepID=A0AAD5RHQ2_9PEZI|nr:hypothetical protein MKZ38_008728 [Zalerion maritima]